MRKSIANKRLLKLAAFLDKLKPAQFDFSTVISIVDTKGCGTVCCAIGWTPAVFPKQIRWNDGRLTNFDFVEIAIALFDINLDAIEYLFAPRWSCSDNTTYGRPHSETVKPKTVANRIRRFVAKHNQ